MKKYILALMLLAFANTAVAATQITEADVRNATLDKNLAFGAIEGRAFLMSMIKEGLPACKQQQAMLVAVEYRKDGSIDLGCVQAITDRGQAMKDGEFKIRLNSGNVVTVPAKNFGRLPNVSRVLLTLKDEFAPLNALTKQNNELMKRFNVVDENNKDANITSRQRERMIECIRGFGGEVQQLLKMGSPFSQNLYEFHERVKPTGDKTIADLMLDAPTPQTLKNLEELKTRSGPLKESLTRVDEKLSKCEAKHLK